MKIPGWAWVAGGVALLVFQNRVKSLSDSELIDAYNEALRKGETDRMNAIQREISRRRLEGVGY